MKVDMSYVCKNFDGKEVHLDAEEKQVASLKEITLRALLVTDKPDDSSDLKLRKYSLAKKTHECENELEVTPEEAVLMKEVISKLWSTLLVGQAFEKLNGN